MFKKRTDFPLKYSDFVSNQINWKAKPDNIIGTVPARSKPKQISLSFFVLKQVSK